ncbi:MAG: ABC transporter ATP-binding protein [Angustibacter sp.]
MTALDGRRDDSPATALSVDNLTAGYGAVTILRDVTVRVPEGAIVAIVGPNGAGKSTLLKSVYGISRRTGGSVTYTREGVDHDVTGWPSHRLTALGLGYVPQLDNVFASLSVGENLEIGATTSRRQLEESRQHVLEVFPLLADRIKQRAGTLSGGQRQTLALARALMTRPTVLLLDEPSAGLSPQAVGSMFDLLDDVRATGVSILLVEQNARQALARADYAYVLETGQNRYEGSGRDLLHDQRVIDLYLGGQRARPSRPTPSERT